jgi:glycosyltransferase involved in cell wall biosynthesis
MRTLVVTKYFPPEIGAPQARLSEMARYWAEAGDEVTVLTGMPNHPTGVIHDGYKGRVRLEEHVDGYRVVRTWLYATPNEGIVKKTLGHLSFMVSNVLRGWRKSGHADVVVVSSPTFFSIFSAYLLAKIKRARFVVDIRNLWPAIFVELGVLTNRTAIAVLERLEFWAYRVADHVVVVSAGFKDNLVTRGVPFTKVTIVRNGVDLGRFKSETDPTASRKHLAVENDRQLVLYRGAHGISHGLESSRVSSRRGQHAA